MYESTEIHTLSFSTYIKAFMNKILLLAVSALGLSLAAGISSCGSDKSKSDKDTSTKEELIIDVNAQPEQVLSDYAKLFKDESKASEQPTDSTYATTASGLKYIVLQEGTGASPTATDRVKVNYRGELLSGQIFDTNITSGEPITFGLNQVIPGWTEGLQLMKVGEKAVFYIPYNLAYGEQGTPGGPIPPKSDLIFTVDLIAIEK